MLASRVFGLAGVLGLVIVSRDDRALLSLVLVALIAFVAVYVSLATALSPSVIVTVESVLIALVIGLAMPTGMVFFPYLVVLPLLAGIARGVIGVSVVMAAQVITVATNSATVVAIPRPAVFEAVAPWLVTGILSGLLGAWLRGTGRLPQPGSTDPSYESARRLLSQLRTVAKQLSSGLDLVGMGGQALQILDAHAVAPHAAVFVRTEGGLLTPLAYKNDDARDILSPDEPLTGECWTAAEPTFAHDIDGSGLPVALPLRTGSRMVGVVLARLAAVPTSDQLLALMKDLDEHSLRLDAAMTFDEVRSIATAEERQRLAREIHDGVAQEVASLGYLVDDLRVSADSERQEQALSDLRAELSRVVSELRLSIFDLRSEVFPESGLGSALSDYVRQVGSRSNLTVHLTLDEAPTRLRAEIEAELLRIAGEAITNARKHSGASNLWVDCTVHPPAARLEIRDDGAWSQGRRADSYGLKIMRERAKRIEATLDITHARDLPGTTVRVTLGEWSSDKTQEDGLDGRSEQTSPARGRPRPNPPRAATSF